MEARNIDLGEWTLSGGGAQGESYNHNTNPNLLLKLFGENIDRDTIINELSLTQTVYENGVPCPLPGELVSYGNRLGIIFQRIQNKKSFCRAIADDPTCLPNMARRLAKMTRELHSKKSTDPRIPSVVDFFTDMLDSIPRIQGSMRAEMEKALEFARQNDTHTLLHGDFHYGNVITDGKNDYFIDLGAFSYGNPLFDISMLYFTAFFADEKTRVENFHITGEQTREFWKYFKPAYFGPDAKSDADLCHDMKPYFLIRTLFFEAAMGPLPIFDDFRAMILKM